MAAPHGAGRFLGHLEEEARAHDCFGQRGARARLPDPRTNKPMTAPINNASARQRTGGPSPVLGRRGNGNDCAGRQHLTKVEVEIAELTERSTHDLRLAWRRLHRTDPPLGLSRDLLIRALAHQLQERTHGGTSRALRRRLQNLTARSHKTGAPLYPGIMLKTGTRLVRHWREHAHTVLVREDGFE